MRRCIGIEEKAECRLSRRKNISDSNFYILISVLILFLPIFTFAQTDKYFISYIKFSGNQRTQDSTMLREMSLSAGDVLHLTEIDRQLKHSISRLTNLGLFTDIKAKHHYEEDSNELGIEIIVKEGLFIIPIPIIELADRNFNVWWTDHKRDFKYLNLGLNLKLRNITGNADELSLLAQWGYDRRFMTRYLSPYFDDDRKWRFILDAFYGANKEVITLTKNGQPEYLRDEDQYLLNRLETKMSFLYRPYLKRSYILTFGYIYNSIEDEVYEVNPQFFNHHTFQRYSQVKFEFIHEERNNKYFATDGWYLYLAAIKNGWISTDQLNSTEIEGDFYYHHQISDHWSWNSGLQARMRYSKEQFPYYNMNNLSTERIYIRGYEYHHIEGNNIGLVKSGITRKIFDRPIYWGKIMPFKNYREMNSKLFLSLNADYGYVSDDHYQTSDFVNKNLFGGGLGLNFLFYNQFSCSFELSMNQKKEIGLFFHINQNFK